LYVRVRIREAAVETLRRIGGAENAGHENTGTENAAQKCGGGKYETRKRGTI